MFAIVECYVGSKLPLVAKKVSMKYSGRERALIPSLNDRAKVGIKKNMYIIHMHFVDKGGVLESG